MAVRFTGYQAYDNLGNIVPLIVPSWNEWHDYQWLLNGTKTLVEYESIAPDFPQEATWFCVTSDQKSNMQLAGCPNVFAIRDDFIANGITYLRLGNEPLISPNSKTIRFEARDNNTNYRLSLYKGSTQYIIYDLPVVGANNYHRFYTLPSNVALEGDNVLRLWFLFDVTFAGAIYTYNQNQTLPDTSRVPTNWWDDIEPFIISNDPFNQGGVSDHGGGTGTFDGTGDDVNVPALPTVSATDTNFITLYNPSNSQLQALASYMWSTNFDLDTFKRLFTDPMQCILGLSIVPVNVPSGGSRSVKIGNVTTSVNMTLASSQYVEVDCGSITVNEFWGAYLDYDPFTKCEIYLPYCGTHPLTMDDVMNKSIHVVYHVDILSGACCAYVKCGGSVLYTFVGQCSCSVPITSGDWTNVVNGAISIAASIGTMVATGGASAPMAASTIAATAVNSFKQNVERSGSMGGMGGIMAIQKPYLIITRPRQALPDAQNDFTGYPAFMTRRLSSLLGFTKVYEIHLENVPATGTELSEIEKLLKSGVIL